MPSSSVCHKKFPHTAGTELCTCFKSVKRSFGSVVLLFITMSVVSSSYTLWGFYSYHRLPSVVSSYTLWGVYSSTLWTSNSFSCVLLKELCHCWQRVQARRLVNYWSSCQTFPHIHYELKSCWKWFWYSTFCMFVGCTLRKKCSISSWVIWGNVCCFHTDTMRIAYVPLK